MQSSIGRRSFFRTSLSAGAAALAGAKSSAADTVSCDTCSVISPVTITPKAGTLFSSNNGLVLEQLAQSFRQQFARTDEYKWGGDMWLMLPGDSAACPRADITIYNEQWPDCADPSRPLVTELSSNIWRVIPEETHFVRAPTPGVVPPDFSGVQDPDFMRVYTLRGPRVSLNNLLDTYTQPMLGKFLAERSQDVGFSSIVPANYVSSIVTSPRSLNRRMEEYAQMKRWLRGKSDPWSVTTINEIGWGSNGAGLYEINVYRTEKDNKGVISENSAMHKVLTATFDYGSGDLQRTYADFNSPPSEIYAFSSLDSKGNRIEDAGKVANYKTADGTDLAHDNIPMARVTHIDIIVPTLDCVVCTPVGTPTSTNYLDSLKFNALRYADTTALPTYLTLTKDSGDGGLVVQTQNPATVTKLYDKGLTVDMFFADGNYGQQVQVSAFDLSNVLKGTIGKSTNFVTFPK